MLRTQHPLPCLRYSHFQLFRLLPSSLLPVRRRQVGHTGQRVGMRLHGLRLLLDDLQKIKDAPDIIKTLKADVRATDMALTSLGAVKDEEWNMLGAEIAVQSKEIMSTCLVSCDAFRTDLQRWSRHSEDGKLSWRDRANVGFFKQDRLKSMSSQLQSTKITIVSMVSIATL